MLEPVVLGLDASPGLLSHSRKPTEPSSSRNTFKPQVQTPTRSISSVNNEAEEELVWSARSVTWSRGCQIYRQYSFDHDKEDVAYAVFAQFYRGADQAEVIPSKGKGKEEDTALVTFGPFHTAHTSRWGQVNAKSSTTGRRLERSLIIFLSTKAYIFFPSGEEIIIHLPFIVEKAWPLSTGGIIVQRRLQKREIRRNKRQAGSVLRGMDIDIGSTSVLDNLMDLEDEGEDLPRVWALESPLEEFKMVTETGNGDLPVPFTSELLLVGPEPGSPVVIYDTITNQVVFYRRRTGSIAAPIAHSPLTARNMRPEDILRAPEPKAGRASLGRNTTTLATTRTDRRQSGKADPLERTTRRAPRLSRTAGPDKDLPAGSAAGELHATLDPPPFAVTVNQPPGKNRRIVSGASSVGVDKSDRRGSGAFMREEAPAVDKRGLFAIGEKDLRDTTMMMGLENHTQTLKSDITLDRLTWDTPPSDSQTAPTNVFISENLWPRSVCVNIQYPSELACFKVTPNTCEIERRVQCKAAVPIISTRRGVQDTLVLRHDGSLAILTAEGREIPVRQPRRPCDTHDEVTRRLASSLSMQVEPDERARPRDRRVAGLRYPTGSRVSVSFDDGETLRVSLDFTIKDRLVRQCSEALSCVLSPSDYFILQRELIQRLRSTRLMGHQSAWNIFVATLQDLLRMPRPTLLTSGFEALVSKARQSSRPIHRRLAERIAKSITPSPMSTGTATYGEHLDPSNMPSILFALHMVAQDCRCLSARQADFVLLGPFLSGLAGSLALVGWWDYWQRMVPCQAGRAVLEKNSVIDCSALAAFETPPDILRYCTASLTRKIKHFPILSPNKDNALGNIRPFENLDILCDIYSTMSGNTAGLALFKAHETIKKIHQRGLPTSWIHSLSHGVMVPILEALRICQNHPDKSWTPDMYRFVGRPDYAAKTDKSIEDDVTHVETADGQPTIGELMIFDPPGSKRLPEIVLPHVRFGSDRRIAEVERIMQTVRVRTISIEDPKGYNENDILHYHQTVVNTIAVRTLAVTVGSGIFDFGTRRTAVTETWDIPPIELAIKVLPGTQVIRAQLMAEDADWPCFHNGVSAGLAISPDSKGIDSSWIVFNRPATLNPEHGGFLLGLGLNGHLRSLMAYHAFPYMEPRHDWTSCGLLLGLAASFAGSQDPLCTKVLSLHTHALLPLGSAELNASPVIQSSALLGLGLVHTGSRNLRMAEVALSEVGRGILPGVELFEGYQESYSFSASMAFGLIMLGKGGKQSSEVDRRLLAKLRRCIFGDATETSNAIDTTVTAPGATLALGLMYLKTNNREIADMLEIPQSAYEADHIRPDILMLRVLARSLIMWDGINASLNWIEAQLPPFLQKGHTDHRKTSSMEIASELAYFNIIAGACFAIGLKLAGTGSELAHNNLIFFFSVLSKASCSSSMTYEGKIRRHAARQCLNVVTLALAAVMSGTGELNVLRRFRISHGQEGAGVTYGTHMATHMAFGILFLGRGHYTLGNSNLAIAAMCISFFPRFQPSPSDNKAYPQAFRHLWALAAEPRCLMARDVDTKETIYLPLRTRIQGPQNAYTQRLISPTLIAPYEMITQIMVDTPRYWPVGYDLTDPADKQALVRKGTMYVKRKAAYLDYNTDPKGNRSMVITAGSISGFDTHYDLLAAAESMSIPASDLQHLIKTHSGIPQLVAMMELFSTDSKFDRFIRNILLECVSMDKPDLCGVYISMWLALNGGNQLRTENMAQFSMIRDFYSPSVFTHFSMPTNERRVGWIRSNVITSAYRKLSDITISDDAVREYFSHEVWTPDIAIYLEANHVPPLDFLRAISPLVMQKDRRPYEEQAPIEVRVRNAARAYVQALQRQQDVTEDAKDGEVKIWKNESIEQAIQAWQTVEV